MRIFDRWVALKKIKDMKNLKILFLFLLFCQSSWADCGHCFTVVKVKNVYNSGISEIGYLQFLRQYILDNNEIEPKENESIKKYFPQNLDTIQIIDKIYQLENIPAFIDNENKRNIAIKEIKEIYLLEWTSIQGAGRIPYLSAESIDRIINSDTFFVSTKIFNVYDENYIYTGKELSSKDFNFFINESYNEADLEPSIIRSLHIDERNNIYPDKAELNKAFEYYLKEINRRISSYSSIKINKEIDEYFRIYNTNLLKKKRYLELVLDYLNNSVTTNLQAFINENIKGDYQKNELLNEINKERDVSTNTLALVSKLYILNEDYMLKEEFYKVIKKENIIILTVGWD